MMNPRFFVCETCGYTDLDEKRFNSFKEEKHKNSSGFPCTNKTLKRHSLGYRFLTDVVQLRFINNQISDFDEAMSVLHGLLRGARVALNIEEKDISGCLQSYLDNGNLYYSFVIFDSTPGGAGHAKRLNSQDELEKVLRTTLNLMKSCDCGGDEGDTSCYSCLRNYGNQKYHDSLKRKYVIDFLSEVL